MILNLPIFVLVLIGSLDVYGYPSNSKKSESISFISKILRRVSSSARGRARAAEGNHEFEKQQYGIAMIHYNAAINENSSEARYYELRGNCYLKCNQCTEALSDFKEALSKAADRNHGKEDLSILSDIELAELGQKFLQYYVNKYNEAVWCFTEAIKRNGKRASYFEDRAKCYSGLGTLNEAISDYRQSFSLDPVGARNRYVGYLLVEALIKCGKYEEALGEMSNLPDDAAIVKVGELWKNRNLIPEAIRWYDQAILKNDAYSEYYEKRGLCHFELKDWDLAEQNFRTLLEKYGNHKKAWKYLIETLFNSKKFDRIVTAAKSMNEYMLWEIGRDFMYEDKYEVAISLFDAGIDMNSSNLALFHNLRGKCFLNVKDSNEKALSDLQKAVDLDPKNMLNLVDLTIARRASGKSDEFSTRIDQFDPTQLLSLGDKFREKDECQLAILCYQKGIDQDPTNIPYYYKRAACYKRLNQWEDVISDWKKVLSFPTSGPIDELHFCELFVNAGKYDEAKDALRHVKEKYPNFAEEQIAALYKEIKEKEENKV